jgi:hypothetical protein
MVLPLLLPVVRGRAAYNASESDDPPLCAPCRAVAETGNTHDWRMSSFGRCTGAQSGTHVVEEGISSPVWSQPFINVMMSFCTKED